VAHIITRFEICKHFRLPFSRGLMYEERLDNAREVIETRTGQGVRSQETGERKDTMGAILMCEQTSRGKRIVFRLLPVT
ncbi:MAG TPA: hypothetical protein PKN59_06760, partial [Syntrophales bacterium]|nr:hypothetical protein [Syntrophales bacterium]